MHGSEGLAQIVGSVELREATHMQKTLTTTGFPLVNALESIAFSIFFFLAQIKSTNLSKFLASTFFWAFLNGKYLSKPVLF